MAYQARVLADSISDRGHRVTSLEATFPRLVLAEFNTHRMLSRNSASSRARPVSAQLRSVMNDPFVPDEFGRNQAGMNPDDSRPLSEEELAEARGYWLEARDYAVQQALKMLIGGQALNNFARSEAGEDFDGVHGEGRTELLRYVVKNLPNLSDPGQVQDVFGVDIADLLNTHKQYPNRLLEPFMWHTVIVTATEWDNFYALRLDRNAQREIRLGAEVMRQAMDSSNPRQLSPGEWHLPLIDLSNPVDAACLERPDNYALWVAAGRCARVSYLTHDGRRDPDKDVELAKGLLMNGHMSPFEHVATPMTDEEISVSERSGNFKGWQQFRKMMPYEDNFGARP